MCVGKIIIMIILLTPQFYSQASLFASFVRKVFVSVTIPMTQAASLEKLLLVIAGCCRATSVLEYF